MSRLRVGAAIVAVLLVLGQVERVRADEADNFTCAARLTRDSLAALDALMNAKIQEAVGRINTRVGRDNAGCDEACRIDALLDAIGRSVPTLPAFILHSRFANAVGDLKDIDRCHLKFRETVYGTRRYNQPLLFPFHGGRIIFVADSIKLSGHVIGLDKVDHFIREGLDHWRRLRKGGDIASEIQREIGEPGRRFQWTENGVKGLSLTGVFAYADLAAGYSGYRFWSDLLSFGRPESFVTVEAASGRVAQSRVFSFAAYVNDAWDESVNRSVFHPTVGKEVAEVLRQKALGSPARDCQALAKLPDARLYVNPACIADDEH